MNLKLATVLIALSLPLAGCGNKGPLVLAQKPMPADVEALPAPPPDVVTPAVDTPPVDNPPPADAGATDADDAPPPLPPAGTSGNG